MAKRKPATAYPRGATGGSTSTTKTPMSARKLGAVGGGRRPSGGINRAAPAAGKSRGLALGKRNAPVMKRAGSPNAKGFSSGAAAGPHRQTLTPGGPSAASRAQVPARKARAAARRNRVDQYNQRVGGTAASRRSGAPQSSGQLKYGQVRSGGQGIGAALESYGDIGDFLKNLGH